MDPPSSWDPFDSDNPLVVDPVTKENGATTNKTATAARPAALNLILTVMLLFNVVAFTTTDTVTMVEASFCLRWR